jgi:V8-like Glu-specific endopeptidase
MYIYDSGGNERLSGLHGTVGEIGAMDPALRVPDSKMPPFSWICALDVHYSGRGDNTRGVVRRTGFLISSRHVLTAALGLARTDGSKDNVRKITVTPALDGSKPSAKERAPYGSIDLKPDEWWIPDQFFGSGGGESWGIAVLTLPKILDRIPGGKFGHWALRASTAATLAGRTVRTSGYASGECTREGKMPDRSVVVDPQWASTQWQASGAVQPAIESIAGHFGNFLYEGATCAGMMGSPIWEKTDRLHAVAINLYSDFPEYAGLRRFSVGLALKPELVELVRQRLALAHVRPTF